MDRRRDRPDEPLGLRDQFNRAVTDGIHELHFYEAPIGLFALGSADSDESDASPALGVVPCPHGLSWDVLVTILKLDFGPEDTFDLLAVGFQDVCLHGYAQLRDLSEKKLRLNINDSIAAIKHINEKRGA